MKHGVVTMTVMHLEPASDFFLLIFSCTPSKLFISSGLGEAYYLKFEYEGNDQWC